MSIDLEAIKARAVEYDAAVNDPQTTGPQIARLALAAMAAEDVPLLIAEVERLRAAEERVRAACDQVSNVRIYGEYGSTYQVGAAALGRHVLRALDGTA